MQILYRTFHALFYRLPSCLLLAFGMLTWVASVILVFLYMISPSYQVVLLWFFSGRFLLLFYVSSYMDTILCFILYGYHTAMAESYMDGYHTAMA